jgi:hypothetical protein
MRISPEYFASAEQFVAALRLSSPRWLNAFASRSTWIFRGQGDAKWGLLPSAWREGIQEHPAYRLTLAGDFHMELSDEVRSSGSHLPEMSQDERTKRVARVVMQRRFELTVVQHFAALLDELGMPLPSDYVVPEYHHDYLGCVNGPFQHSSQGERIQSIYGLAQHHRTPTRFLDWTTNSLYAAFFAADDRSVEGELLAVWAVNREEVSPFEWAKMRSDASWGTVSFSRYQSPFLHAQSGLFTTFNSSGHQFMIDCEWPDMEAVHVPPSLCKLTLPRSEVPELKRLLRAEGISRAHLMPTMDQVSETAYSEWEARWAILSKIK